MRPLSPGRARVLQAIRDLTKRRERVTFRNIARECGLSSTSTVKSHIDGLIKSGHIVAHKPSPYAIAEDPNAANE